MLLFDGFDGDGRRLVHGLKADGRDNIATAKKTFVKRNNYEITAILLPDCDVIAAAVISRLDFLP